MWCNLRIIILLFVLVITVGAGVAVGKAPDRSAYTAAQGGEKADITHYIDANNILMFVTNIGNFGRDLADYFGNDYGTYYPYSTPEAISSGADIRSPLYARGLWIGGIVGAETRVTVSEYASEYCPGPMAGGTYQTDRAEFKVYKLFSDSTSDNPNSDWLNWPADQGAPLDQYGHPRLLGDQTIWTVFNDADPTYHTNNSGETDPLGIEVQQTT